MAQNIGFREFNNLPLLIAQWDNMQKEYLEHIGGAMVEQIDQGFDNGTDALGRQWAPLKDGGGQTLVDTGRMRDSIDYQVNEGDMQVAVGGDVEYLQHHEFGTESMPARPILRPASTWVEDKLADPLADDAIGDRIDMLTRSNPL